MKLQYLGALLILVLAVGCSNTPASQTQSSSEEEPESSSAKALLQGYWVDDETDQVSFRAVGDTIFYPDSTSQPTYFKIVRDSLVLLDVGMRYPIVKQSEHAFWFTNQNGDLIKLSKSDDPLLAFAFVHDTPHVMTYTDVVKHDSVITYNGQRYHWYIAINPTRYKVHITSYNADGVEVDNVYYDNIIHISLFHDSQRLFASDFRKSLYGSKIPAKFLEQAVLSNMEYAGVDQQGVRFVATVCIPDGAACYKVQHVISFKGKLSTTLLEF